jgi:hypothetical protein
VRCTNTANGNTYQLGSATFASYSPLPSTVAPTGACTVAGTLEVTADGHGTFCKAGTLVWTTLY